MSEGYWILCLLLLSYLMLAIILNNADEINLWFSEVFVWFKDCFSPWEYGMCREWQARKHRHTSRVQFLCIDSYGNKHWYDFSFCYWCEFYRTPLYNQ
jgi:hypothetical protein